MQQTYFAPPPETTNNPMMPREKEWSRQLLYAMVLAMLLIGLFLLGNPIQVAPTVVSVLPFLVAMSPIPLVLFFALWEKHKQEGELTVQEGFVFGEMMIRYAALAFGLFTLVYSLLVFELASFQLILASAGVAVAITWLLGAACAVMLAVIFSHFPLKGGSYSSSPGV